MIVGVSHWIDGKKVIVFTTLQIANMQMRLETTNKDGALASPLGWKGGNSSSSHIYKMFYSVYVLTKKVSADEENEQ